MRRGVGYGERAEFVYDGTEVGGRVGGGAAGAGEERGAQGVGVVGAQDERQARSGARVQRAHGGFIGRKAAQVKAHGSLVALEVVGILGVGEVGDGFQRFRDRRTVAAGAQTRLSVPRGRGHGTAGEGLQRADMVEGRAAAAADGGRAGFQQRAGAFAHLFGRVGIKRAAVGRGLGHARVGLHDDRQGGHAPHGAQKAEHVLRAGRAVQPQRRRARGFQRRGAAFRRGAGKRASGFSAEGEADGGFETRGARGQTGKARFAEVGLRFDHGEVRAVFLRAARLIEKGFIEVRRHGFAGGIQKRAGRPHIDGHERAAARDLARKAHGGGRDCFAHARALFVGKRHFRRAEGVA